MTYLLWNHWIESLNSFGYGLGPAKASLAVVCCFLGGGEGPGTIYGVPGTMFEILGTTVYIYIYQIIYILYNLKVCIWHNMPSLQGRLGMTGKSHILDIVESDHLGGYGFQLEKCVKKSKVKSPKKHPPENFPRNKKRFTKKNKKKSPTIFAHGEFRV